MTRQRVRIQNQGITKIIKHLGSQQKFANHLQELGIHMTQPGIHRWLYYYFPADYIPLLLQNFGDIITAHDLRPDLYKSDQ